MGCEDFYKFALDPYFAMVEDGAMIQISGLKKSFGTRVLFDDVNFSVNKGEVIGLVGRNGSGKSTLFKILRGEELSDQGDIHVPKGYRLGFLDQHIHFTKETLIEECCTALPPDQVNDQYKAETFLFGLGFTRDDLRRPPAEFSGGYQLRINLVKALLKQPDLLLLDEPTNYLDILSLAWLRNFLKNFSGEVILITHDREFMDSVVTHIMGINRGKFKKISGHTEKYYQQLVMEDEIYEKTRANQERKIKEMQAFVDRFRAKNTKAKQAQSRVKAIQRMTILGELMKDAELGFKFNYKETPGKVLMTVQDLSFGFDENEPLFSELSFRVKPGDCIAVIGKNGKGKTTLLNVLSGQLQGKGHISCHPDAQIGYYQQTNKKNLHKEYSVYEEITSDYPELGIAKIRAICGAMMFPGEDADKKIKVLSGGEQGRVLLGKVIAKPCNLLFLDEPTNHLDMESIQVMMEQIGDFKGGVLLVTHDEALLRNLATQLIIFKEGQARLFLGTYEEFLEKEGWDEIEVKKKEKPKIDRKALKRKRAEIIQERAKALKPIKSEIESLEASIIEQEELLEEQNKKTTEMDIDSPETKDLFQSIGKIQIELATKYEKMDELIEKMNQVTEESDKLLSNIEVS